MSTTSSTSSAATSTASSTASASLSSVEGSDGGWRKSRIYTKTGDTGTTSLYNMQRKCKAEDFFQALGTVDEVNSQLGSVTQPPHIGRHCNYDAAGQTEVWWLTSGSAVGEYVSVWCASTV